MLMKYKISINTWSLIFYKCDMEKNTDRERRKRIPATS